MGRGRGQLNAVATRGFDSAVGRRRGTRETDAQAEARQPIHVPVPVRADRLIEELDARADGALQQAIAALNGEIELAATGASDDDDALTRAVARSLLHHEVGVRAGDANRQAALARLKVEEELSDEARRDIVQAVAGDIYKLYAQKPIVSEDEFRDGCGRAVIAHDAKVMTKRLGDANIWKHMPDGHAVRKELRVRSAEKLAKLSRDNAIELEVQMHKWLAAGANPSEFSAQVYPAFING